MPICAALHCDEEARTFVFCERHFTEWSRGQLNRTGRRKPPSMCALAGCTRDALALGWCRVHYKAWSVGRLAGPKGYRQGPRCSVEDCTRMAVARGLCPACYAQQRRTGSTDRKQRHVNRGRICSTDGCGGPARARGFCQRCYRRYLYHEHGRPSRAVRRDPRAARPTRADGAHTCVVCGAHYDTPTRGMLPLEPETCCTACSRTLRERIEVAA